MKTKIQDDHQLVKPRHARRVEIQSGGLLATTLADAPIKLAQAYAELDSVTRPGRVPAMLLHDPFSGKYLALIDLSDLLTLITGVPVR